MGPGGTLTSFGGGIATLMNRAGEVLGDCVRTGMPVTAIEAGDSGYTVRTTSGDTFQAESVIVAAPTYAASEMVRELDDALSTALAEIPYASMAVVCSAYNREDVGHDLYGFGFLVPRTQQKRMLGCIWTSTLFPGRAPEGKVLLRTMIGGASDPEAVGERDETLLDTLREELFPILDIKADPVMHRIYRYEKAIPQYTFGHQARLRAIEAAEERHPGLRFAGNAYRGVGLNDCVVSALRAVALTG
jgi:oxygen-dependent protoporphyrinogen oxidase